MEPNKILSASILDLIFDDRNKEYGAYELRVTYPERVKKSLFFVFAFAGLALAGVALANRLETEDKGDLIIKQVTIEAIKTDEPEPLPEPIKKPELPPQVRTEQFTTPVIVQEDDVDPPPTQEELATAKIDVMDQTGVDDNVVVAPQDIDKGTGIIEPKVTVSDEPFRSVEVDAKFIGDWPKFLFKNLNPNVPVDNEAPSGKYAVMIEFIVDIEGNVSNIRALTNHGYGMEQEAMRVLKKATKWEPAFQNGNHVKAYRRQPIIFIVE